MAHAGALADTAHAYNDGFTTWQGGADFDVDGSVPPFFTYLLKGTLEYAVFGPGKFADFISENSLPGVAPAVGNDYLYAYQILGDSGNGAIDDATPGISIFTVGVDPSDQRGVIADPIAFSTGAGNEQDIDGPTGSDQGTSMAWLFTNGHTLETGEVSQILLFSSPSPPELDSASISSGGAFYNGEVASIGVPEPASMVLWAIGLWGLASIGRRRVR